MIQYICKPSKKKKICRDVMEPYASSLGFNIVNIDTDELSFSPDDLCVLDYCWVYETQDQFDQLITTYHKIKNQCKVVFRLVDDNPSKYNDLDMQLLDLITKEDVKVVAPYDITYLGSIKPIVIPYHYEMKDEIPISDYRKNAVVLSGLINSTFYPYRTYISEHYKDDDYHIEQLIHPGYSGRLWGKVGFLGKEYIEQLAKYKIMIVTSDDESEVLKNVECAEAGCIPIGYLPKSLIKDLGEVISEPFHFDDPKNLLYSLKNGYFDSLIDGYHKLAPIYRGAMRQCRSKSRILKMWEDLL